MTVEDGAPFEWPERRAGWPGSRIGGHQTRDGWLPTCSLESPTLSHKPWRCGCYRRIPIVSFAFWESLCIYGLNITESHAEIPTDILVRLLLVPEARRLGLDIDREVAVSKRYARASPEAYSALASHESNRQDDGQHIRRRTDVRPDPRASQVSLPVGC